MDDSEPLDSTQIAQMTWIRVPGANRSSQLSHTPSLEQDFRDWLAGECVDHSFEIVEVTFSNGQVNYRKQCHHCGQHEGAWISKSKIAHPESLPKAALNRRANYEQGRRQAWQTVALRHYHSQSKMNRLAYQSYLSSPEWKARRAKVLARANGVCEGCGDGQATEVHHVSYHHIFDEFLWELRAVCDACHDRIHPEHMEELFSEDVEENHVTDDEW